MKTSFCIIKEIYYHRKESGVMMKKTIVSFITAILLVTALLSPCATISAETDGVDIGRVTQSMSTVTKSIENLKEILPVTDAEAATLMSIFNGVSTTFSVIGSFVGPINGCVSFLKLVGLMKDPTAAALANIQTQLVDISEKLSQMDNKLNEMTQDMIKMQATEDFNTRAIKANQMIAAWNSFETEYMEKGVDELIRQYNVMMTDGLKEWNDNLPVKNETVDGAFEENNEEVEAGNSMNMYKVVIWYKCINADAVRYDNAQPEYQVQQTIANGIDYDHERRQVVKTVPYTIYKDDLDLKYDRCLCLDESFFPETDENWKITDYRNYLSKALYRTIYDAVNDETGRMEKLHPLNFTFKDFAEDWSLINEVADEAINRAVYKIAYSKINASSDFPTKVIKSFREYCKHVLNSAQGVEAMLKTMYLTHAFEFEIADDVNAFLNQMIVKTGSYGVFASDVVSISQAVTDEDKLSIAAMMCDTIDSIDYTMSGALVEEGRYCYITNTVLDYATLNLSASETSKWHHRGDYYGYDGCSGGTIDASITSSADTKVGTDALIGDSDALVIAYTLKSNGYVFNHDFMNERLSFQKQGDHGTLVTSLDSPVVMTKDADIRLSTYNIIGSYFKNDPNIYLNSLPSSAELEYVNIKNMIAGTSFDAPNARIQVHKPLLAVALYGESHNLWIKDESALMFGPTDVDSFTKNITKDHYDVDVWGNNYYKTTINESVDYNCLISLSYYLFAELEDENSALSRYVAYVKEELPEIEHEHIWNEGEITREADEEEPGIITYTCIEDPMVTMTERFVVYSFTQGEDSKWSRDSGSPLKVKAIRKPINDSTMTHFDRLLVDGKEVDEADYELSAGSIIVALKPSFLKNLSLGEHTLRLEFDDGSIKTNFTITEGQEEIVVPEYKLPITGIE